MKRPQIFKGTATALVTPFRDGKIDFPALGRLIERQLDANIDALVIGGTTGEAATLTVRERSALYSFAAERIRTRAKLILGVGTNDTRAALTLVSLANRVGCDGTLAVTPYYNKGTDGGIVLHFQRLAEASAAPMLLYNVPTRTGVNLSLPVLETLAEHENVVGIKEASDSAARLAEVAVFGQKLALYAGNDAAAVQVLALGGQGVVSVASGLFPKEIKAVTDLWFEGRHAEARQAALLALPLEKALFLETNPAPVKFLHAILDGISEEVRLPLAPPAPETKAKLLATVQSYKKALG